MKYSKSMEEQLQKRELVVTELQREYGELDKKNVSLEERIAKLEELLKGKQVLFCSSIAIKIEGIGQRAVGQIRTREKRIRNKGGVVSQAESRTRHHSSVLNARIEYC